MSALIGKMPPLLRDLLVDFFGTFFVGLGLYNFASVAGFAPGGVSGASLIVQELLSKVGLASTLGVLNMLFNIPIIIFSWRYVGRTYLLRSFRTTAMLSLVMDLVCPLLPLYEGAPLYSAIFGGAFVGLGLAIEFGNNTCTGGADLIVMSFKKIIPHMSLGQLTLIIDGVIIVAGGFVFGNIDAVFLGIIFSFFVTRVMDIVMNGALSGKMALIITDDGFGMGKQIDEKVDRGATIIQGKGAYSGQDKEVVLCAMSRQQLPVLRKVIQEFDPKALLIVLEYNEVFGTGFQSFIDH